MESLSLQFFQLIGSLYLSHISKAKNHYDHPNTRLDRSGAAEHTPTQGDPVSIWYCESCKTTFGPSFGCPKCGRSGCRVELSTATPQQLGVSANPPPAESKAEAGDGVLREAIERAVHPFLDDPMDMKGMYRMTDKIMAAIAPLVRGADTERLDWLEKHSHTYSCFECPPEGGTVPMLMHRAFPIVIGKQVVPGQGQPQSMREAIDTARKQTP